MCLSKRYWEERPGIFNKPRNKADYSGKEHLADPFIRKPVLQMSSSNDESTAGHHADEREMINFDKIR